MNLVVAGLDGCAVYLVDVVEFSDMWDDHIQRIGALFSGLTEAHLTVSLSKCEKLMWFLGLVGYYWVFCKKVSTVVNPTNTEYIPLRS